MTELDLEIPGLAFELISEYGKLVSFSRIPEGSAYDPATGTSAPVPDAALSVKAIVEPDKGSGLRAGLVESADYKLSIAAESLPNGVSPEDKITFDNAIYTVALIKPTFSGELIALYEIWVRR